MDLILKMMHKASVNDTFKGLLRWRSLMWREYRRVAQLNQYIFWTSVGREGALHFKEQLRQKKMAEQEWPNELVEEASARQLSQIANLAIEQDGFFQSAGQLIDPSKFTKKMLNDSEVLTGVSISSLVKRKGRWELTTTAGSILTATDIVLSK